MARQERKKSSIEIYHKILAKDIDDNIPELAIYDGIGLVDINIVPHLDSASEEYMEDVYETSQFTVSTSNMITLVKKHNSHKQYSYFMTQQYKNTK